MNAQPSDLVRSAQELSDAVIRPIPGSRKIHVQGSRADLRVPLREIIQAQTPGLFGGEENPPIAVYDTSGPYTDPDYRVDLVAGLPAMRAPSPRFPLPRRRDIRRRQTAGAAACHL